MNQDEWRQKAVTSQDQKALPVMSAKSDRIEKFADGVFQAMKAWVKSEIELGLVRERKRADDLLAAEGRLVALIEAAKDDKKRLDELEAAASTTTMKNLAGSIKSFEVRLARHAEHLSKLETRLQALEHK